MDDTKYGTCPVCGKRDKFLHFVIGAGAGKIWCDYICLECMKQLQSKEWDDVGQQGIHQNRQEDP